jgi:hypothetical protein
MPIIHRAITCCAVAAFVFLGCGLPLPATASGGDDADSARRGALVLETGPVWFSRNDVRIPGDSGTRFDMLELTGNGPEAFARLEGIWDFSERHGIRLLVAPLEVSGTGDLPRDTQFADETFAAGPTRGTYKFNTYRVTYRYTFYDHGPWRWRVGGTVLVRDANIELRQGSLQANDDDLGFVPVLYLHGEYALGERWRLALDFDGLAGGPGRAFDVALKGTYELGSGWRIGGGYRLLEGGADTDDVYNFAWLHYAVASLEYHF